jgi:enoyl-CoA hydratase
VSNSLIVERRGRVAILTLNRPEALNALNAELVAALNDTVTALDADEAVGAILITGSHKAFAAGADIKEMADKTYPAVVEEDFVGVWDALQRARTPIIAAVSGFALGGGCELAMMCDVILAADTARFGQPEIKLGIIPGIGGTQRLVRAIGKAKAMEMILTGRMMDAAEAERAGLVARVVPADSLLDEAVALAETIAAMPRPAVVAAKDAIGRAFEASLAEGLRYEKARFYALFATQDQKEGMAAFVAKRPPAFRHR